MKLFKLEVPIDLRDLFHYSLNFECSIKNSLEKGGANYISKLLQNSESLRRFINLFVEDSLADEAQKLILSNEQTEIELSLKNKLRTPICTLSFKHSKKGFLVILKRQKEADKSLLTIIENFFCKI